MKSLILFILIMIPKYGKKHYRYETRCLDIENRLIDKGLIVIFTGQN